VLLCWEDTDSPLLRTYPNNETDDVFVITSVDRIKPFISTLVASAVAPAAWFSKMFFLN
jgi:hypothetical protein